MKVAIFKVNQLGDNVVFLPVVQTMRRLFPDWEFLLVTSPVAEPLYDANIPPESRLIVDTAQFLGAWKSPKFFWHLLTAIRSFRPDACLLAHDQGNVAHLLALLSGSSLRVGIKPLGLKFDPKLNLEVAPSAKLHAAALAWETGRALVQHLGRRDWPVQTAAPNLEHLIGAQAPIANRVVIHPGASRDYQRWPIERFVELAERLAENSEVLWIESREIEQSPSAPGIQRVRPSSIHELTRILASSSLFLGNNSGPMNLVFALGRPAVILNGPTTRMWDPFWYPERVLMLRDLSLSCLACDSIIRPMGECHNRLTPKICLNRWSVDEVEGLCLHWMQRWKESAIA